MHRIFVFLFVTCLALPAAAANKVAMVVGNNTYPQLGQAQQLHAAHNDAQAVAEILERNGFRVFLGTDLSRADFIQMLFDFTGSLHEGDIALFFYAGHGVAINGANYLLPSDIRSSSASRRLEAQRLASLSIDEQSVLTAMKQSGAAVSLAILDACRDNPLKGAGGRSIGAGRGLQRMELMPQGTFSIYSAGYGQVALDRLPGEDGTGNSVFTRVLLDRLQRPGMTVRQLALSTREEVRQLAAGAGHIQSPAYYDELGTAEPVLLTLPSDAPENAASNMAPASSLEDQMEMIMIEEIRSSDQPEDLRAYLETYPNGRFAALARARLGRLQGTAPDLETLQERVAKLRAEQAENQALVAALSKALQDSKSAAKEHLTRLSDVQTELAAALRARDAFERQTEELQDQIVALRENAANLQAALDAEAKKNALTKQEVQALGSELNTALARLAAEQRHRQKIEDTSLQNTNAAEDRLTHVQLNQKLLSSLQHSPRRTLLSEAHGNGIAIRVSTLFSAGGRKLSSEGQRRLKGIAKTLDTLQPKIDPNSVKILISGFSDDTGTEQLNLNLSEARAEAVASYLKANTRLRDVTFVDLGFGEAMTVASNGSSDGRDRNRRIEISFGKR